MPAHQPAFMGDHYFSASEFSTCAKGLLTLASQFMDGAINLTAQDKNDFTRPRNIKVMMNQNPTRTAGGKYAPWPAAYGVLADVFFNMLADKKHDDIICVFIPDPVDHPGKPARWMMETLNLYHAVRELDHDDEDLETYFATSLKAGRAEFDFKDTKETAIAWVNACITWMDPSEGQQHAFALVEIAGGGTGGGEGSGEGSGERSVQRSGEVRNAVVMDVGGPRRGNEDTAVVGQVVGIVSTDGKFYNAYNKTGRMNKLLACVKQV